MRLEDIIKTGQANNIPSHVMYNRVFILQWSVEKAIKTPACNKDKVCITLNNLVYMEHIDIAKECNIPFTRYMERLNQGWSLSDIILAGNTDLVCYKGVCYKSLVELSVVLKLSTPLVYNRLYLLGWSLPDAVEVKSTKALYEYSDKFYSISELADLAGISKSTVKSRLSNGWSVKSTVETPISTILYEKQLKYDGRTYTTTDLVKLTGLNRKTILARLDYGWSVDKIINTPIQVRNKKIEQLERYTYKGNEYTLSELVALFGINRSTLVSRLNTGWSITKALETPTKSHSKKYMYNGRFLTIGELANDTGILKSTLFRALRNVASPADEVVNKLIKKRELRTNTYK